MKKIISMYAINKKFFKKKIKKCKIKIKNNKI